jgi:hypothetical protein
MTARRIAIAMSAAVLLLVGPAVVAGQETPPAHRDGWVMGGSVGVLGPERVVYPGRFTVGAHWTRVTPGRLGPDFSVGTVPALLFPRLVVGARGGVALPIALTRNVYVLPSGGVSMVSLLGPGALHGAVGLNAGIAAMAFVDRSYAVRVGVTAHRLSGVDGTARLVEVGLVRTRRR